MQYFKQDQPKQDINTIDSISNSKHNHAKGNNDIDHDLNHSDKFVLRNLKWDIIFAEDIFFILKSFLPENGSILKVEIYPSM